MVTDFDMRSAPFFWEQNFLLYPYNKVFVLVVRYHVSIPGVKRVFSSNILQMYFFRYFAMGNSRRNTGSFKTISNSTNSGSYYLSWKCGTYTFNEFSLALWNSRNEGHLFRGSKIDAVKSYYQLLEDTFTRNRSKGFFDIRRTEKVLLYT